MQKPELKILPYSVSKFQISEMYQGHVSLEKRRRVYKFVMQNHRDKALSNNEWCEFISIVGVPPGYCNFFKEGDTWVDRLDMTSRLEKQRS